MSLTLYRPGCEPSLAFMYKYLAKTSGRWSCSCLCRLLEMSRVVVSNNPTNHVESRVVVSDVSCKSGCLQLIVMRSAQSFPHAILYFFGVSLLGRDKIYRGCQYYGKFLQWWYLQNGDKDGSKTAKHWYFSIPLLSSWTEHCFFHVLLVHILLGLSIYVTGRVWFQTPASCFVFWNGWRTGRRLSSNLMAKHSPWRSTFLFSV